MDESVTLLAQRLIEWFEPQTHYAIALSGGVDSAVVAQAAARSASQVVVVTGRSSSVAARELSDAQHVGQQLGVPHRIIDTQELNNPLYLRNDERRCYFCKQQLFAAMHAEFPQSIIVTGTNADDLSDYRPGLTAAKEAHVRAPLAELGIDKSQVRSLAKLWQMQLADKPASPCLASRIAHGVAVTAERLQRVEQAEELLRELGLVEFRVRLHDGELARIEVGLRDLAQFVVPETQALVVRRFRELGFRFVTLDLEGFRSGSLNPTLVQLSL
jgi:pyridinium-3,5-biscarboxylic acid mononucleotide sulfurtransferase